MYRPGGPGTFSYPATAGNSDTFSGAAMDGCDAPGPDLEYITTGSGGWIFTVHNYELYGGVKKTSSPR